MVAFQNAWNKKTYPHKNIFIACDNMGMDATSENSFQNANENRNNGEKDGGTSGILLSDFLKRFRVQNTTKKRSEGKDTMNKEEGKGVLEDIKLNQLNSGKEK